MGVSKTELKRENFIETDKIDFIDVALATSDLAALVTPFVPPVLKASAAVHLFNFARKLF